MDIAVLSDIHSNYIALETCITYALNKNITHFIFLGDYISDCPYPQRVMELLYYLKHTYHCWFIKGNREEYMLDYREEGEQGWIIGSCSGSLLYTFQNLTKNDLDFFHNLPIHRKIELIGLPSLSCCHGSMTSSRELLYKGKDNTKKCLEELDTNYLLSGHIHVQGTYEYKGKKLINPGSVGIPWYHDGKAQFAIIHGTADGWQEEYIQLDYDRKCILDAFDSSGLSEMAPIWVLLLKNSIHTGIDLSTPVLSRTIELCKEETGEAIWPYIAEKYWEQAVFEQGIDL